MRWLDVLLVFAAAFFVVAGPLMALGELAQQREDAERALLTGEAPPPTVEHRALWRAPLPAGVLVVGALGTWTLVRVNARRDVRALARRPGLALLAGMTVLDLAYFVDWGWLLSAPYALRAMLVALLYPLGGVLVAGGAYMLASLEDTFAPLAREPAPR